MAGYSGTPLAKKLGIKDGAVVALAAAPAGFVGELEPLPAAVRFVEMGTEAAHVVIAFFTSRAELTERWAHLGKAILPAGGLWIAWPKKASKVPTDITEDVLREIGLPTGLVDNKVCAINETWSGLRFVWRNELRAGLASR